MKTTTAINTDLLAVPFKIDTVFVNTVADAQAVDPDAIADLLTDAESASAEAHGFSAGWVSSRGESFGFHSSYGYTHDEANKIVYSLDDFAANEPAWDDNDEPRPVDAREAAIYLASDAAQSLLLRYHAGWFAEWNGNNNVGDMTDDGREAATALLTALNALPRVEPFAVCDAEEWLQHGDTGVDADSTDDQIGDWANDFVADAQAERVQLDPYDVRKYLERLRDEAKTEASA